MNNEHSTEAIERRIREKKEILELINEVIKDLRTENFLNQCEGLPGISKEQQRRQEMAAAAAIIDEYKRQKEAQNQLQLAILRSLQLPVTTPRQRR